MSETIRHCTECKKKLRVDCKYDRCKQCRKICKYCRAPISGQRDRCLSCAMKQRVVPKEVYEKQSKTARENYASGKNESWCKGLTKETDQRIRDRSKKISKTRKEKFAKGEIKLWCTGLTKKDHPSIAKIAKQITGKGNGKYGVAPKHTKRIYYKNKVFRSSWEAKLAEYFDNNKIEWEYEKYRFAIDGGHTYLPDFIIYENGKITMIIEVKGYITKEAIRKIEILQSFCVVPVKMWNKKKLKQIGLDL